MTKDIGVEAYSIGYATEGDVPQLAALARAELPFMTFLHDDDSWSVANRLSQGTSFPENFTLVVRNGGEGRAILGYLWMDAGLLVDRGIYEPWYCLNAVVVDPESRGKGIGRSLVLKALSIAMNAGATMVYGQSVQQALGFWQALDFQVLASGAPVRADPPALMLNGSTASIRLLPGPGDSFILKYLITESLGGVSLLRAV